MDFSKIDAIEEDGIEQLITSIARLRPDTAKFEKFTDILLQRYWISQEFTHIYDAGLDRLTPQALDARPTIRRIIREEYPNDQGAWKTPSHREDLMEDMLSIGIPWQQFTKSRRSRPTAAAISSARNIIYRSAEQDYADLRILTFLRFWGEVLTAIEYEQLFPRIKRHLSGKQSKFYEHHKAHDARIYSLSKLLSCRGAITHADKLGRELVELVDRESSKSSALSAMVKVTKLAIENKLSFYDQF